MLFFRDRMSKVRHTFESKGLNLDLISAPSLVRHDRLDLTLHEILLDARRLTSILNSISPGLILDCNTFLEMIISICSRLIRYHPLQDFKQISSMEAVYHIGLTIFMMTSFLQLDGRQILRYDLVTLRLKETLDDDLEELDDDLVLWLMIIGGIWTLGGTDGAWLIPRIRKLAGRLGIDVWADVLNVVSRFPWIGVLHDEAGREVWKRVYQGSQVA
jgi:hypothetical protein